jgi:hypothetical protein
MNLEDRPDESLLREQVSAGRYTGSPHRLLRRDAQHRAEAIESELRRRGILFQPIDCS